MKATVEDGDSDCEDNILAILDCIESAGLTLVDAELHQALVEAVRARAQWERTSPARYRGSLAPVNAALDRAVALLAERGGDE